MNKLICPISSESINKVVVRLTGFLVAGLAILYIFTMNPWILVILGLDFLIRAFPLLKFSPLSLIACGIAVLFKLKPVMIDKAPKLFAARVGLLFSIVGFGLFFVSPIASTILIGVLCVFALLESVFNFCVGCVVYTYVILPASN